MVFKLVVNAATGISEWVEQDSGDKDAMLRTTYVDMLQDTERNAKYNAAIKSLVGPKDRVLDIGTGTGLLSMIAARCGPASITACELFEPMAKLARDIIADNGLCDSIKVIQKRSTDLEVPVDMAQLATVCISEILDSGLLGEDVLTSIHDAKQRLLTRDARILPTRAVVYARLFESPKLAQLYKVPEALDSLARCNGCCVVPSSIQADQLETHISYLSESAPILDIDFQNVTPDMFQLRSKSVTFPVKKGGRCHGALLFWELFLSDEISISTAPLSWHPSPDRCLREHWKQLAYFNPQPVELAAGCDFVMEMASTASKIMLFGVEDPCPFHRIFHAPALQQLNNLALPVVDRDTVVLDLSDSAICSRALGTRTQTISVFPSTNVLKTMRHLNMQENVKLSTLSDLPLVFKNISLETRIQPLCFPFYFGMQGALPLDLLIQTLSRVAVVKEALSNRSLTFGKVSIHARLLKMPLLARTCRPVGTIEGFDLSRLDRHLFAPCDTVNFDAESPFVKNAILAEYQHEVVSECLVDAFDLGFIEKTSFHVQLSPMSEIDALEIWTQHNDQSRNLLEISTICLLPFEMKPCQFQLSLTSQKWSASLVR